MAGLDGLLPTFETMHCLVIADDLTGACDAAVHFAARGLVTSVMVTRAAQNPAAQVLAFSTETRNAACDALPPALSALAAEYPSAAIVFKKIDSTLRGNPGLEVAAAREAFACDTAIVCPAFPKLHRVVERGYLRVTSAAGFAPLHVAELIERQSAQSCAHTPSGEIAAQLASGTRTLSVDATCDADLDRIVAAVLALGRRVLWAGSGGLASALARRLGSAQHPPRPGIAPGGSLFCIGSNHPVTLGQQSALVAERPAVQAIDRTDILTALAAGKHVILRIPRGALSAAQLRETLAGAPAAALVLSGGDTASLVCAAAGVRSIELCDEIVAGVPWGILQGGIFAGIPVATKSGAFGERDALIRIADFFHA